MSQKLFGATFAPTVSLQGQIFGILLARITKVAFRMYGNHYNMMSYDTIYDMIGGWCESNQEVVPFVGACVRAKLRVPARRCCFRGWAAEARIVLPRLHVRVSFPCGRKTTPLLFVRLLIAASRCFPLLPVASRGFPLLPVASRCFQCAFPLLIPVASRARFRC